MRWKYIRWAILVIVAILILIPAYKFFGSIDWAKNHSNRIAALPVLQQKDDAGEFRVHVGKLEFLVRVGGMQNDGPALILLHGFPESSIMWNALLKASAKEGYRVLAFDQRGYSPGARPKNADAYQISHLTKDVLDIADKVGFETFHLVGHDWGALLGWNLAIFHEQRILSFSSLTIPHPGVFFEAIVNHPEQMQRSAYIERLQKPLLPEYKLLSDHQAFFKQMMRKMPKDHLDEYVALQAEFGATTATLNWYRALDLREVVKSKSYHKEVKVPTLFIWGTEDGVIAPSIIPQQKSWITGAYREVALHAGHALMQMKEDSVVNEILVHVNKNRD